jgi:GNAT superfamily N-acetyltransferase
MLDAFNRQVRQDPHPGDEGYLTEREGDVVRVVRGGWAGVTWSNLDSSTADSAIAAQIARFAGHPDEWEWKHYSYDTPADLPDRLMAAGFQAEPTEAVLVATLADLELGAPRPAGIELREVTSEADAGTLIALLDEIFGSSSPGMLEAVLRGLEADPCTIAAFMALVDGEPVAGGRVEFHFGSDFASLWGGATKAEWRGLGIFRALLARACGIATERGFTYVQADASDMSEPILKRLGFVELATTTPFKMSPAENPRSSALTRRVRVASDPSTTTGCGRRGDIALPGLESVGAADHVEHDLVGAGADAVQAHVAPDALDAVLDHVAGAAVDLDAFVGDFARDP